MPEASVYEWVNPPIDISLAGRTFKARKVGVGQYLAACSAMALNERIRQAKSVRDELPEDERVSFMAGVVDRLPKGTELDEAGWDMMKTRKGTVCLVYEGMKADNAGITQDQVAALVDATPDDDVVTAIKMLR